MLTVALIAGLLPLIPAVVYALRRRQEEPADSMRRLMLGLTGFNVIYGLAALGLGLVFFAAPPRVYAAGLGQTVVVDTYASLAAGIATGLGSIGAGYAVGNAASAAIGVIAEKPEAFGRVLIFVGLAEGIAIYGLLIAFMLLGR